MRRKECWKDKIPAEKGQKLSETDRKGIDEYYKTEGIVKEKQNLEICSTYLLKYTFIFVDHLVY